MGRNRKIQLTAGAIVALGFIALPFLIEGYWIRVITSIFMYAIITAALNIIAGYAGYAAFGNIVFFGIGRSYSIRVSPADRSGASPANGVWISRAPAANRSSLSSATPRTSRWASKSASWLRWRKWRTNSPSGKRSPIRGRSGRATWCSGALCRVARCSVSNARGTGMSASHLVES